MNYGIRAQRFRSKLFVTCAVTALIAGMSVAQSATLVGRVSDPSGVNSLPGATVEIVELGRTVSAGPGGEFRFSDVAPGNYTLRIRYVGAETIDTTVALTGDELLRRDVMIGAAAGGVPTVLIVGQRALLSSSLSIQRSSDNIESVLTRDAIGQFPDQNVAEALRRIPGVNILNDQGEGRFVSVRGLDPSLNSASINGARLPAPEADVRSVALDVVSTDLIESIEIKKSLTPDMDADTLGASIEIRTTSSLQRDETFLGGVAEASYNDLNGKWSNRFGVDFSTRITDRVGIAGGASYNFRTFSTDNIEAEGWDETGDGTVFADTLEYRDYDVERTRWGGSLSFDLKPAENTTLYLRGLYSKFEDQEFRGRLGFEMDEEARDSVDNTALFDAEDGEIKVFRDLKDRFEAQTITSLVGGGQTFVDSWTFDYSLSWSTAEEEETSAIDPVSFERDFEGTDELQLLFDYSNWMNPRYDVVSDPNSAFFDASEFEFDSVERTTYGLAEDVEWAGQIDVSRQFPLMQGSFLVKGGAKYRSREKSYGLTLDVFDGYDGDLTAADFLGTGSYGLADINPQIERDFRSFFEDNIGDFELNELDSEFESNVADYMVQEDIVAAYLMGRYDTGNLRVIGGVRMENTRDDIFGNLVELVEEGATYDGNVLTEDTVFVTPIRFRNDYTHWLPSLNLIYETGNNLVFRLAGYRSLMRPKPGDIAPRFLIEENDDDEREGEFGNPDLKPYEAWNFDAGVEWYFAPNAVLQGGIFYKTIDNFIVSAQFEDVTFNGVFADEGVIPINGDKATVRGLEFGYQQALTDLPSPFDGVLVGLNYTFTETEGDIGNRTIPLPSNSRHTVNAFIGYEKGPVSVRVAAAYRSGYLDELGDSSEEDRYVMDHMQYDVSLKYRINDHFQIFTEFVNLSDEPYVAFQRGPNGPNLLQYEEYSWTGKIGIRATM